MFLYVFLQVENRATSFQGSRIYALVSSGDHLMSMGIYWQVKGQ